MKTQHRHFTHPLGLIFWYAIASYNKKVVLCEQSLGGKFIDIHGVWMWRHFGLDEGPDEARART